MSDGQLGILLSAAIDAVNAKAKLNSQIKQLKVEALKVGVQLDTTSAKQAIKQLQTQKDSFYKTNINGIDAEIKKRAEASRLFSEQIKSQMQQSVQAEKAIAAAQKQSITDDTFSTSIKKSQQDLLNLKESFHAIGNNSDLSAKWQNLFDSSKIVQSKEELQNLNAKIGLFKKEIGASNALIDQSAIKALKMIAMMKSLQFAVSGIKSMVDEVVKLDTSLTELNKVFDFTGNQLQNFTARAFNAAESVGRTGREMIDATTQFKKAGYELENSLNLAKATLIMTNIGDGITDVTAASSSLIAVLKGFNIDDSNVMSVLDSMNSVANQSPIAFENIAEGLQRVSGTLSQTGTDIHETIGLLTGGFSQLRSIEKVSTALVTISQRLRGVGEDGEAIDGLSASLQKEFGAVGIAIEDANGELRSTYDILADYAGIYDTLSSKQQEFLSGLASGKRQAPVINAIVQQWDDVEKAIDQSTNSLGSAERENAIFMQSIQGKLNILKSTFQEFATETIDSGLIKSLVDIGTVSLKTVDSLGGLQNILILITGLLVAKNWNSITSVFTGIIGKIKDIPTAFRTAKQESAGLSGAFNLLGISASTAQLAIGALTAALTIGIAIYSHFKQAEEEARQAALAAADEANQQTIAIAELTGKYLKLAEAVDLDGDSKKELLSLQQQLLKNFDLEGESVDDLTKKYGSLTEAIKAKTLEALQAEQIDLIGGLGAAEKTLVDSNSSGFFGGNNILNAVGNDAIEAFKALEKAGIINSGSYGSGGGALVLTGDESTVEGALENYNRLGDALEVLRSQMGDTELQNNSLYMAMFNRYQELEPSVKGYNDLISQLNNNLSNQVVIESLRGQEIPKTKAEFDALSESAIKTAQANGQFIGSTADIKNSIMGVLSTMPQFQSFFSETANQTSVLTYALDDISNELESFNTGISKVYSSMDLLDKAADEFSTNGMITADTFKSLSDNNLLQYLQFTSDGLNILTGDLLNNEQAVKQKAQADLAAALYADLLQLATVGVSDAQKNAQAPADNAGNAAETMGQKFANSASGVLTAAQALDMFNSVAKGEHPSGFDFKGQEQQFNKLIGNYNSAVTAISKMGSTSNSTANSFKRMGTGSKSATSTQQDQNKALEEYLALLEHRKTMGTYTSETNQYETDLRYITDLEYALNNLTKTEEERRSLNEKIYTSQKKALEDEKARYESVASAVVSRYDEEIDSINESIKAVDRKLKRHEKEKSELEAAHNAVIRMLDKEIEALQTKYDKELELLEKNKSEREKAHNAVTSLIDDEIKKYQKEQEAIDELYNPQIEAIQKQIDLLKEKNDESQREIDIEKAKAALENAKNQKTVQTYVEGQGLVYTADQDAIREAQENLDKLLQEKETSDLEKQLAELEKEREEKKEAFDDQIKDLEKYKEQWDEILSSFEKAQNIDIMNSLFGEGWSADVLAQNTDILNQFKDEYLNIQQQLADTLAEQEAANARAEILEGYKQQWQDELNSYRNAQELELADKIFYAGWEQDILNGRHEAFDIFKEQYLEIQDRIVDDTLQKEKYEREIERIEGYKAEWQSMLDEYNRTANEKHAMEVLGAEWEEDIFTDREAVLEKFKTSYDNIQSQIIDINKITITSNTSLATSTNKLASSLERQANAIRDVADAQAYAKEQKSSRGSGTSRGFASGTSHAPRGLANTDELGEEYKLVQPTRGKYTLMQDGDMVLNHQQTKGLFDFATNPTQMIQGALSRMVDFNAVPSYLNPNNSMSRFVPVTNNNAETTNFTLTGNLSFPNITQGGDAEKFVRELKNLKLDAIQRYRGSRR